jgi:hypothetical protein
VRFDDAVQHAAFGVARLIWGAWHARTYARRTDADNAERDTWKELGERRERMLQAGRPLSEISASGRTTLVDHAVPRA